MGNLVRRIVVVALVLGIVGAGYAFTRGNGKKKEEVTYEWGQVTREDVRSFVSATGVIQPWKTVDVKSDVAGRIERLFVDLGHRVKRGQLLMEIDPTDTRTALEQAKADLAAAEARLRQARVQLEQQKQQAYARVAAARENLDNAKARLAEAKANAEAQPALTDAAISQAEASLVSAQRGVDQASQQKRQLEQQLRQLEQVTIPFNIANTTSNLEQARANLATAQAEYRRQRNLMAEGYVARSEVEQAYARMKTAEAAVRTAEQRLKTLQQENDLAVAELRARIAAAQSAIDEAQARVRQAQAQKAAAETNRYLNEVSDRRVEAAKAAVAQAEAELKAATAELQQIQVRKQETIAANSAIVRSKAARDQAQTNLRYTKVVAPRDGVIIAKQVEEGTVVPSSRGSIGSTNYLLQIGDTSRLWIKCNVDETDIGQVSVGQKVTVRVDAYPSMLIDGKVIRIDPQAIVEQNVTLIPVTVEIDMPDERFKPGMNATCEFIVDEAKNVLTVPNEALKENEGVFTVQKNVNGRPSEPIEVEVGLAGQDRTEVRTDALKEGDEVLTRVIEPEKPETNNPFGNPFGRPNRRDRNRGGGR